MADKSKDTKQSIWSQNSKDVGNSGDKETMRIYEQLTGGGLVGTEDNKKKPGSNRRV